MNDVHSQPDELDLRDYLAVLRSRKLTVLVTTVVVTVVAVGLSLLQTPQYRATAEVLLERQSTEDLVTGDQQQAGGNRSNEAQRIQTEVEVMRSRSVRTVVREQLGYAPSVRVGPKGSTSVVTISATDADPQRAAEAANTYASVAIDIRQQNSIAVLDRAVAVLDQQVAEIDDQVQTAEDAVTDLQAEQDALPEGDLARFTLQEQIEQATASSEALVASLQPQRDGYVQRLGQLQLSINGARADGGGQVVSEAVEPRDPFSPDPVRNALIALLFGLLLGAGLAFLRDYLDDRIRTKDDLDAVTGRADVLGLVPLVTDWKDRDAARLITVTAPASPAAEAYRTLRTSLQFIAIGRTLGTIQVTSSAASEGKTTTLSNLGVVLADAGHRVVVVDCDLRRPRLHRFFGVDNSVGFSTAILGADVAEVVQEVDEVPHLHVVTAGPTPPNPSELLASGRARELLAALAEEFDYVVVDCPPLLPVADAAILAAYVDATLLVATVGTTTKRSVSRSLELIRQVDAPLVGVVLNGLRAQDAYSYTYGDAAYAQSGSDGAGRRSWRGRRDPDERAPEPDEALVPDDRETGGS